MIISERADEDRRRTGLHDFFDLVRRRRLSIAVPIIVAVAAGAGIAQTSPKLFMAEAAIALDSRKLQVIQLDAVVSRLPQESPVLRTEIDVIGSRSMAERVLQDLSPDDRRRLSETLREQKSWEAWLRDILEKGQQAWAAPMDTPARHPAAAEPDYVGALLKGVRVSNDGRSFTIFIAFTSPDQRLAAVLANAYAQAYINHQTEVQKSATRTAREWLGSKLEDLARKLEESESLVQSYRRVAGLTETNGTTLETQQITAMNNELAIARSNRAGTEARLQIATQLATEQSGLDGFNEALASPVIQQIRRDEVQVSRTILELESAGASKSAQLPALRSQLASIGAQLKGELNRVLASLRNEVEVARKKERELEAALTALQMRSSERSRAVVELNQLEREARANQAIYESFLNRYKQAIEQEDLASPEADLISRATLPQSPASPKLLPTIALSLFGGTMCGFGLALLRDRLDRRVRSCRVLEETAGLPVIALLPKLLRLWSMPLSGKGLREPPPEFAHAVQYLAATLQLSPLFRRAHVLMVTSALPGDGKTTVVVTLARSLAASGRSVLALDCNLRSPAVAAAFGTKPRGDMARILADEQPLDEAIQRDPRSGASFISTVRYKGRPECLLHSAGFPKLVDDLRSRYDIVLIDTPATQAAADATLVGAWSDAAVLVVRWGATRYADAADALRRLNLCGANVSGIVIDAIEPQAEPDYDVAVSYPKTMVDAAGPSRAQSGGPSAPPRTTVSRLSVATAMPTGAPEKEELS